MPTADQVTFDRGARVFVATDLESAPWWLRGKSAIVIGIDRDSVFVELDDGRHVTVHVGEIRLDRRRQPRRPLEASC